MYTPIHAQICGGIRVAAQWLMYRQHSGSVDTISKDDNGRLNSRSFGEGPRCDSVRTHKALELPLSLRLSGSSLVRLDVTGA